IVDDHICLLRPSDWMPPSFESLDDEFIKGYRLTCYSMALEKVNQAITDFSNGYTIILDQGNHKYDDLRHSINTAKQNGHKVVLLFVNSCTKICKERAGDKWVGDDNWSSSISKVKESLPKYKK